MTMAKKSPAQLSREIAETLAKPYSSKYGHGSAEWQSGYDFAKESIRHETRAQMRESLRGLHAGARTDYDRGMLAAYTAAFSDVSKAPKRAHSKIKKPRKVALRVAYRLQLTPGELRGVEFARGRYSWPDMLSAHASESGAVAFTEPEMWQWCDDVDSDAEGGHSPFPLASGAFAEKLQGFYDEKI